MNDNEWWYSIGSNQIAKQNAILKYMLLSGVVNKLGEGGHGVFYNQVNIV